jgi:Right handed beta helix region
MSFSKPNLILETMIFFLLLFILSCSDENTDIPVVFNEYVNAGLKNVNLWDPPQDAVFIDPLFTGQESDGSMDKPYSNFNQFPLKENMVYAIKRGTTLELDFLVLSKRGIVLGSYGSGERPVLRFTTKEHAIATEWTGTDNIAIRDLTISAPNSISSIYIRSGSKNAQIINCSLSGGIWGIRALSDIDGLYIDNCEIFETDDDGLFIQNSNNIEISNCYIHHVNLNWKSPVTSETEAAGDGIQMETCNHWHIHHNIIDRTTTGNKFCFISNNPAQNNGIFEYNALKGPKVNGSSVYIGSGSGIIVRYNFISGPSNSPVYSHAAEILVHHNIFYHLKGPLYASKGAMVFNNVFYDIPIAVQGEDIESVNNVFLLTSSENEVYKVENLVENNNLHVNSEPGPNSLKGDPAFYNPEKGDFHTEQNSICIDNGVYVGIDYDIEGNEVPNGSAPDIGAYERK